MDEQKGTLYFFTGLAGAGKTTIGGLFYQHLKARKANVAFSDGDRRRANLAAIADKTGNAEQAVAAKDYSTEARLRGAKGMFQRYKAIVDQGKDVVCCGIAMYDEVRDWNRANIENYVEIYIKVSMETLIQRDQKGLYTSGEKNVVGVDLPWDEPKNPDIVIENEGDETPEAIVDRIEKQLGLVE